MKKLILIGILVSTLVGSVVAQERTVTGNMQVEASWNALQAMIGRVEGNVTLLQTDVGAMKTCAAQLKIWDPAKGCVNIDTSQYEAMLKCADEGKLYDKSLNKCVAPTVNVNAPTCSLSVVSKQASSGRFNNNPVSCPSGSYTDITSSETDDCPGSTYSCTKTRYNCVSVVCK